jgi:hypothetical protein
VTRRLAPSAAEAFDHFAEFEQNANRSKTLPWATLFLAMCPPRHTNAHHRWKMQDGHKAMKQLCFLQCDWPGGAEIPSPRSANVTTSSP